MWRLRILRCTASLKQQYSNVRSSLCAILKKTELSNMNASYRVLSQCLQNNIYVWRERKKRYISLASVIQSNTTPWIPMGSIATVQQTELTVIYHCAGKILWDEVQGQFYG